MRISRMLLSTTDASRSDSLERARRHRRIRRRRDRPRARRAPARSPPRRRLDRPALLRPFSRRALALRRAPPAAQLAVGRPLPPRRPVARRVGAASRGAPFAVGAGAGAGARLPLARRRRHRAPPARQPPRPRPRRRQRHHRRRRAPRSGEVPQRPLPRAPPRRRQDGNPRADEVHRRRRRAAARRSGVARVSRRRAGVGARRLAARLGEVGARLSPVRRRPRLAARQIARAPIGESARARPALRRRPLRRGVRRRGRAVAPLRHRRLRRPRRRPPHRRGMVRRRPRRLTRPPARKGARMIDLHTSATPNGRKVSIMLEETELPYRVHKLDLSQGEQHKPEFLSINPNGKIPAIVDGDVTVFESGAILIYLAEKTGKLLAPSGQARYAALEWLMFQMSGVGPFFGQVAYFNRQPEKNAGAIERFTKESLRILQVLDGQLATRPFIA